MPNKIIETIYKERLRTDTSDRGDLQGLFNSDEWKRHPLSVYYGADEDADHLVNISVLNAMATYCRSTNRRLPDPTKSWLVTMAKPETLVYKADDFTSALEILSTAAMYTTERRGGL